MTAIHTNNNASDGFVLLFEFALNVLNNVTSVEIHYSRRHRNPTRNIIQGFFRKKMKIIVIT